MWTEVLQHKDGTLRITPRCAGRLRLDVEPATQSLFVPVKSIETSYSIDLIKLILNVKGLAWVCDEISRDEDPNYVSKYLMNDLLAYFDRSELENAAILDFGCGSGASTSILAREFPLSRIVGVELSESLITIARARAEFYHFGEVRFQRSPTGIDVPDGLGQFDFVVLSAVYEHLLPNERSVLLRRLWDHVKPGGCLFLDQTPNRLFPIELHTTFLPLINYMPGGPALWYARRFSSRVDPNDSWQSLLRQGIRGATFREISETLRKDSGDVMALKPSGGRDRIDLWLKNTNADNHLALKQKLAVGLKFLKKLTGVTMVPDLALAFRKI